MYVLNFLYQGAGRGRIEPSPGILVLQSITSSLSIISKLTAFINSNSSTTKTKFHPPPPGGPVCDPHLRSWARLHQRLLQGEAGGQYPARKRSASKFQVDEIVGWVNRSYADFVILGGDFNTSPKDNVSFIPKINLRITIIIITTITKGKKTHI